MGKHISVIIPNRNGGATIGRCLESVFSSDYDDFDVTVVDDCSEDNSVEIIMKFPCTLIRLENHSGAAQARNAGAEASSGDILFFTDADCLVQEDTLVMARQRSAGRGPSVLIGGTYTKEPADEGFFNRFQSTFINYSETKHEENPDYLATHALAIHAATFRKLGGFAEPGPILEDVEFSHRARRAGYTLMLDPRILVRHIFRFSLAGSLRNAVRKARYWTYYSLRNGDIMADSGTASCELKVNVLSCFLLYSLMILGILLRSQALLYPLPAIVVVNSVVTRGLFKAFRQTKGMVFAGAAYLYCTLLYSLAVGAGACAGVFHYFLSRSTGGPAKNKQPEIRTPPSMFRSILEQARNTLFALRARLF